eukprot:12270090-Heterocapsa_arctica.AAC.1
MFSGEALHEDDDGTWWDDDAYDGEEPPNDEEMDDLMAVYYQGQQAKKRLMGASKGSKGRGKGKPVKGMASAGIARPLDTGAETR